MAFGPHKPKPPKPLTLFVPTETVRLPPSTVRLTNVQSIATKTMAISSPASNKRCEEYNFFVSHYCKVFQPNR
ncbi:hypothetical protein ACOSQ3_005092 [Xanthoceras sorbifolium]